MFRLAIVTTHPIQYNAPLFSMLAKRGKIDIHVFYTWGQVQKKKHDPGFGKSIEWDIPLLDGYNYTFVNNVAKNPGSHHFKGIDNPNLINLIQEWKADAILVYGWRFKSHLKVLRYFKGKILVMFRGDSTLLDLKLKFREFIKSFFLKRIYQFVDIALYTGTNNKEYFLKYGLNDDQLVFAPHAIDNNRFSKNESNLNFAKEKRNELGISENDVVFLFAAKFEHKKNPKLLLESFEKLRLKNSHLIMVGNGILEKNLTAIYKHNPNIHFMDFQNQSIMPSIYQMADVFVLPSQGPRETWGLAINEAMASSKAILASNKCGATIDLIEDGFNGYKFTYNHKLEFEKKLILLNSNPFKLIEMGNSSFLKIKEWSFKNICESIENVIYVKVLRYHKN